jgi:hypothetical protein
MAPAVVKTKVLVDEVHDKVEKVVEPKSDPGVMTGEPAMPVPNEPMVVVTTDPMCIAAESVKPTVMVVLPAEAAEFEIAPVTAETVPESDKAVAAATAVVEPVVDTVTAYVPTAGLVATAQVN